MFRRIDLDRRPSTFRAHAMNVGDTQLGTTLSKGEACRCRRWSICCPRSPASASTTAYVEVSAAEVPIMDGSAGPFVFLLQSAGIAEQRRAEEVRARAQAACECDDGDK